jgi:uncharacterized Ntn-hydrolase superfamily protein
MLGVATSSKAFSAGSAVPYCRPGVGAVASQAVRNPYLGVNGLLLLEQGLSAPRVIERLVESDQGRDLRQVGVVDGDGRTAAYTGSGCIPWAGQVEGGGYICLGNILVGQEVVTAMARAFEGSVDEGLPERLMRALEAGQSAGGDRRGRQSAGIKVVHTEDYPYCDLRVDDHEDPVSELRRLVTIFQRMEPFLQLTPQRDDFTPYWEGVLRMRDMTVAALQREDETVKESR